MPTRSNTAIDRVAASQRLAFGVWILVVVAALGIVFQLFGSGNFEAGRFALGGLLVSYGVIAMALAGRLETLGTTAIVALGMIFSFWFGLWTETAESVITTWLLKFELGGLAEAMSLPGAIAAAGLISGAILYIATGSSTVVVQVSILSLAAGLAYASPLHSDLLALVGTVLWHAGASATLLRWGISRRRVMLGLGCPACGTDLTGISAPTCPGCGLHLPQQEGRWEHSLAAIEAVCRKAG